MLIHIFAVTMQKRRKVRQKSVFLHQLMELELSGSCWLTVGVVVTLSNRF